MPLTVTRRKDNDTLQITGRIDFPPSPEHPEGYQRRIRLVPQSTDIKLAREEAAALETRLIREAIHGKPAAVVDPIGSRVMLSTPAATTTSWAPDITAWAAKWIAC